MAEQLPHAIDERVQQNVVPIANQIRESASGLNTLFSATQQMASQAHDAAQFTARAHQEIQQLGAHIGQIAFAAPALAAPPLGAPTSQQPMEDTARMLEDEFSNLADHFPESSTANPKLPMYSGADDPDMWIKRVKSCFCANSTPADRQGHWMVCALQGEASNFWHI